MVKPAPEKRKKRAPPAGPGKAARGVLERAIGLLLAFVDGQARWGVRELAAATGEPASTVHRMLNALRDDGLVEFSEERKKYEVGIELYRIAAVLGRRHRAARLAEPILAELAETLNETAWLAEYDAARARMVCMADATPAREFRPAAPVGGGHPVTADAAGWAVLACLDPAASTAILKRDRKSYSRAAEWSRRFAKVREVGYAVGPAATLEFDDIVMVAAPVRDALGEAFGSLCIAAPRERLGAKAERRVGFALRGAAGHLSQSMGATLLGGAALSIEPCTDNRRDA